MLARLTASPRAGLPLGGVGVLTAMIFSFVEGNTFLTTAAGSLGGLVGGVSLIFLPWTGIQGERCRAKDLPRAAADALIAPPSNVCRGGRRRCARHRRTVPRAHAAPAGARLAC